MKQVQWITLDYLTEGEVLVTPSTEQKVASTAKPGIKSPCSPRAAQTAPTSQAPTSCSYHHGGASTLYFYVQQKNINIIQELLENRLQKFSYRWSLLFVLKQLLPGCCRELLSLPYSVKPGPLFFHLCLAIARGKFRLGIISILITFSKPLIIK